MTWDDLQLRRYLLGDLTDEETESMDVRIISDETSRAVLETAEQDLVEDYLEGSLSDRDRTLFLENFLVSDERREDLDAVRMLKNYSAKSPDAGPVRTGEPTFLERILSRFRPLSVAVAVLVVGLLAFAAWQIFLSDRPTALEAEYAVLNQADLGLDEVTGSNSTVQLATGQLRDAGSLATVNIETLSDSVLFRLGLLYKPSPDSGFRIELLSGERKLFTIARARAYSTPVGAEVRALIPRSVLLKGQNQIRMTDNERSDLVQTFYFQVQ